ncbi:hypothetical protein Xmau_04411 [Xenorhabdus mauleonii]|uniref:Uncharacterized protein n=1 Tax=Xenorhabdus mauleonii TaxID=351675 RepID=A0A1I3Y7X6_9GAMM|nr:hypothetical protein [Xenorhabdus mauleonii]PHM35882.1 hypothetical protein Xmau_04411 [Xenorhabdus mauleonii]SFK27810.1 hypothetical protein SAMN05421680_1468 [Xenorhabdus mauleonii]
MEDILNYLLHNSKPILALISAFCSGVLVIIYRVYKGVTFLSNRRISKNKHYLNEYIDFINNENKKHIENMIESEVMFKVTKIKSSRLRNLISKLERNDVRPDYIRDIRKLNFYVSFDTEFPVIKIDFQYKLGRFFEMIIGGMTFFGMILTSLILYCYKNEALQVSYYSFTAIFLIFLGCFSVFAIKLSPSRKRIKELNKILSECRLNG